MPRGALVADGLLVGVAVAWGATYFVAKDLLQAGSVLGMLSVRMSITAILLGAVLLVQQCRPSRQALRIGATLGLLLSGVFVLETFGIAGTSPTNAGVIISLTMVFTPFAEAAALKRQLDPQVVLVSVVAFVGVILLSTGGGLTKPRLGDWLVLGAALMRTFHVTVMKRRTSSAHHVDSLSLTFAQLATCAVTFAALAVVTGTPPTQFVAAMNGTHWLQMGFLTVVCTVFPFWVQMWAVQRTSASHVALLLGTEPLFAALFGVTLAGDRLGAAAAVGVVIVLTAVGWNQARFVNRHTPAPPKKRRGSRLAITRGS